MKFTFLWFIGSQIGCNQNTRAHSHPEARAHFPDAIKSKRLPIQNYIHFFQSEQRNRLVPLPASLRHLSTDLCLELGKS